MRTSSLIMAVFIFVGMAAGLYGYYSDFVTPYSNAGLTTAPASSFLSSYTSSSLTSLNNIVHEISGNIENIASRNFNLATALTSMGILFLKVIWWIIQIPALIINIVVDLMNIPWILEPIPNWFISMVSVLITTYVIFRLASTVMGGRDL